MLAVGFVRDFTLRKNRSEEGREMSKTGYLVGLPLPD
jgi:hypothetical protein